MVTYFNKRDLISFGEYLLSKERDEKLKRHTHDILRPWKERKRDVSHADFTNWKDAQEKKKLLNKRK